MSKKNPTPATEALPELISFTIHKQGTRWGVVAQRQQGDRILEAKALETDPHLDVVQGFMDRYAYKAYRFGWSPFE